MNCFIDVTTSSSGSDEVDDNNTPLLSSTEVEALPPSSLDTTLSIIDDSLSAGPSPSQSVKDLTQTLRITVREDGSVDWEEALASGTMISCYDDGCVL